MGLCARCASMGVVTDSKGRTFTIDVGEWLGRGTICDLCGTKKEEM